jgi:L-amino acid N-acyltransferase YncA
VPDKASNAPLTACNEADNLLRMSSPSLRAANAADAAAIADVYNHFVHTSVITFEESAVSVEAMCGRIQEISSVGLPWVVLAAGSELLGYAYASKWKVRAAYRFAVETTIYLRPGAGGQGYGTSLYQELLRQLRAGQFHAAIGGIALPNEASVRLHERLGFNKVAHFNEVGFKLGRWVDVGYWQVLLQ